jgi:putative flavoprotein involved in K+ transport
MPRTYRGRDILWWLDACGVLDQRYDETGDLARVRNVPSMQLVGSPGRTVDLNALTSAGVRLAVPWSALRWSHGDGLVLRGLSDLPVILHP